ncbi:hypothetical protein EW146_g156 [Bondarzewia mesenterica]|uniref:Polycystin cation channel PKD1/PKD2 domain-containing protein n=1 Tax=Bondarzewia mesenterica TaxID=1095465 RepID=A0A4S4M7X9_9AGAM|nr:hypothetical protein EW146_g156 [Bondarzewia mesenterica]
MDPEQQTAAFFAPSVESLSSVKVFPLIYHLKKDVTCSELGVRLAPLLLSCQLLVDFFPKRDRQLTASDINFAIVRPLVFKYARLRNPAIVYACLVVRSHFLSAAENDMAYSGVNISRASLCEILAMKLVSHFANNRIQLVSVLTTSWSPLAGAPIAVVDEVKGILGGENDIDDPQSALEMAIATRAKAFVSSPIVQTVVNDIYAGHVVYSIAANRSIVADNYKLRAIEIYDNRNASWFNHYRLRVPKYGAILEFLSFALLFVTFVLCLWHQDANALNPFEVVFILFAAAFALEEYTASKEHGWGTSSSELGFDVLACGACILFPRLAFFLVSNNVVVLALRGMIAEFVFFMGIAAICFSGLLFTLLTLAPEESKWTVKSISWLMVQIWFGNTYLSFGQASSFHPFFGPILMTMFAALSNTLLLTILISILSNTFARINANANQEYLFQFTITTLEGVKSDALFSYQPPFNLFAFIVLWPASFFLSPRSLHTANVFLTRLTSFPILIAIALYERYLYTPRSSVLETTQAAAQSIYNSLPRALKAIPILEAIMGTNADDVYQAIFDVDMDLAEDELGLFSEEYEQDHVGLRSWASRENGMRSTPVQPSEEGGRFPASRSQDQSGAGPRRRPASTPRSPGVHSLQSSPRLRKRSLQPPPSLTGPLRSSAAEVSINGPRSPLSRLFGRRVGEADLATTVGAEKIDRLEEGIKKVQELLEDAQGLPVAQLKDEMKELQERQARIEGLLMMLTRGMRNEVGSPPRMTPALGLNLDIQKGLTDAHKSIDTIHNSIHEDLSALNPLRRASGPLNTSGIATIGKKLKRIESASSLKSSLSLPEVTHTPDLTNSLSSIVSTPDILTPILPASANSTPAPAIPSPKILTHLDSSFKLPRELQLPKIIDMDSANPNAPANPPFGFPPQFHVPDIPIPDPRVLFDHSQPKQSRVNNLVDQFKEFFYRIKWLIFLPFSWFFSFQHAAFSIALQIWTFPAWLAIDIYERKLRTQFTWMPSVWGSFNAMFPNGITLPTFHSPIGDIMFGRVEQEDDIPTLDVDMVSIAAGGSARTVNGSASSSAIHVQMKQLETVLQGVKELPVQGIHGGIKELQVSDELVAIHLTLQDSQARIENMLQALTQGTAGGNH